VNADRGRANRAKGADFERAIAAYLRLLGIPADRTSTGRAQHHGDIDGLPGLVLELKNTRQWRLGEWLDQATEKAGPNRTAVIVLKRRGVANAGRSYAVLELGDLLRLLDLTDDT